MLPCQTTRVFLANNKHKAAKAIRQLAGQLYGNGWDDA